jgi:hypothetical protein
MKEGDLFPTEESSFNPYVRLPSEDIAWKTVERHYSQENGKDDLSVSFDISFGTLATIITVFALFMFYKK